MDRIEVVISIVALAALLGGAAAAWAAALQSAWRSRALLLIGGSCVALMLARWLLTEPTFVHANMHGPLLLNVPWQEPLGTFRNYGAFGSLVHGGLMHLFAADLAVLAFFDQLFAVLTVGTMAALAASWTGSRWSAVAVALGAALHPVLMRQGSSEDAHNLAVLLSWLALYAMEQYARSRRRVFLLVATAAAVLMVETRQILFAALPLIPLLPLARQGRTLVRDRAFVVAVGILCAALILRVVASAQDPVQVFHVESVFWRLARWDSVSFALAHHPLLDWRYGPHLLPLMLVGSVWLVRRVRGGWFMVASLALLFLSSLWLYEGRNVALMFRLPVLTVGIFLAGIGAWYSMGWIAAQVRRRWPKRAALLPGLAVALGLLLLVAPRSFPGWQLLSDIRPLTGEYSAVRTLRESLPRRLQLVDVAGLGSGVPAYDPPIHLLEDAGIEVRVLQFGERAEPDVPILFLRGAFCQAYSLGDHMGMPLASLIRPDAPRQPYLTALNAMAVDTPGQLTVPSEPRPECRRALEIATPVGTAIPVPVTTQDSPFVIYGVDSLPVQFYELDPTAYAALEREGGSAVEP